MSFAHFLDFLTMISISKLPLFRLRYFERKTRFISALLQETQRNFSVKSVKSDKDVEEQRKSYNSKPPQLKNFKKSLYERKDRYNYGNVNLYLITDQCIPTEGAIVNTFLRLHILQKNYKHNSHFVQEFKKFLNSNTFAKFCNLIESKVSTFESSSLLALYNLEYMGVSPTSPLMNKIFKAVLDNFCSCTLIEKLSIYAKTKDRFSVDSKDLKEIIALCEEYVNTQLETDLQYEKYSYDLLPLLDIRGLPRKIRLLLANKLAKELIALSVDQKTVCYIIKKLVNTDYDLLTKDTWLKVFKINVSSCVSHMLLCSFCSSYVNLVTCDKSFYCPDLVSLLKEKASGNSDVKKHLGITLLFIKMGHFDKSLIEASGHLLSPCLEVGHIFNIDDNNILTLSEIFARLSFHEIHQEFSISEKFKALGLFNFKRLLRREVEQSLYKLCKWCQCMTYLGFNTKNILDIIFATPMNEIVEANLEANIFFLHHLAKAYFTGGYTPLSEASLNHLVNAHLDMGYASDVANLNEYFGSEEYVLKKCVSSKNHVLDFLAIFDENNRPLPWSEDVRRATRYYFDEMERPSGSKMIAFQRFVDSQPVRFINKPSMTSGIAKMFLKAFEDLDCGVVLLTNDFVKFTPEEKKNYLETEINEVLKKM